MRKNGLIIFFLLALTVTHSAGAFYQKLATLPEPRHIYGAAVLGDYLYVIGGYAKDNFVSSVIKAPILIDGTLGSWSPTTPLPHPLAYISNSTIVLHDVLYVVGGYISETNKKQTILWTKPRPDGELSPWRETPPFPGEGVSNSVVVSTPGHIYLIGGLTPKQEPTNKIWTAIINDQGEFVRWEASTPLPVPLWFHNAGVVGGRIWVWGGLTTNKNTSVNALLFSAPVFADGSIGKWRTEPFTLPQPFYRAACTASGPFLISFCPSYAGGTVSNDVWYAEITDKGILPWQRLQTDLTLKVFVGVATDYRRGLVFMPGGKRAVGTEPELMDNSVYCFWLSKKAVSGTPQPYIATTITTPDDTSKLPRLSYLYLRETPAEALPGFLPYEIARQQSQATRMPLVVYFHSPRAKPCQQQHQMLQQFDFTTYKDKLLLAWVDTVLLPQLVQQLGVFRVPCWIYFDASGKEIKRKIGIITETELQSWLFGD